MGALDGFKGMFARRENLAAVMDDPFIQIDKNATSDRLKLAERGAQQGAVGQPPADLQALDPVESEIIAHVLEAYSRTQTDAANGIRTYDGRLAELGLLGSVNSITASARTAVSDFRKSVANALNRFSNSRDAIRDSYQELRDFRSDHGLRRPAHRSISGIAGGGAILLTWLGETALNASLLRQNDELGYLGGVVAAATIGILNVGLAAVVGRQIWPLTQHRSTGQKVGGWAGIVIWLAVVVFWNLGAAHYRDAKVSGVASPEVEALAMMGGGLDSIYSWALLVAGILFAMLAALSGFRMDDPYPGYGRVFRRHDERCETYAHDVEDATLDLQEIRDDAVGDAAAMRDELLSQNAERGQILAARAAFARRFVEHSNQLEVIANALLQDYRTANLAARSTPPPAHFSTAWQLTRLPLPPTPEITVREEDIREAEQALDRAVQDVSAAFDEAITQFEPLDKLKQRLSDG